MFNDIKETNRRIATKIKSIAGRNKTLRADIQSVLCDIAAHTYQHGDVTAYNNLFTACKGQDRTALAEWITVYGFAILRPDGTFGKNKDAIANADYADAEAVFAEYTDEATIIPAWFTLVKSASQIAAAMKPSAMVLKLAADIGKHSDPHSDLADDKRKAIQWGDSGEFEHAVQQLLTAATTAQGRINANIPSMAIAAE